MAKFKVGDKVRVKPYSYAFPYIGISKPSLERIAGNIYTITGHRDSDVTKQWYDLAETSYSLAEEMLELAEQPSREFIVIRRSGAETIAELRHDREVIKSAKATCAPSDTFDLDTGAKLAFDRLMGREADKVMPRCKIPESAPQPAHRFKVGDRVVVEEYKEVGEVSAIDANDNCVPYLVFHASGCHSGGCHAKPSKPEHTEKCSWFSEGMLSPAPAPEPPKFYTGKVAALLKEGVQHIGAMKVRNRVFDFVNGSCDAVQAEYLTKLPKFESIEHLRKELDGSHWIEIKEQADV